jgi:hypothetical protein
MGSQRLRPLAAPEIDRAAGFARLQIARLGDAMGSRMR